MAKKKKRKNIQKEEKILKAVKRSVLHFLRLKHDKAFNHKQIAAGADLRGQVSHDVLLFILDELVDTKQIEQVGRGKYKVALKTKMYSGILDVTRDGYGFVVLEEDEDGRDVFIGARKMGKALHGDKVSIRLTKAARKGQRPEGEVVEVLERATDTFIGLIEANDKLAFFTPDNPRIGQDFFIPLDKLHGAKTGEKVLVKLLNWQRNSPEGEVVRVLGAAGENETEMHAILFQFGFVPEFPEEVEAEVAKIKPGLTAAEIKKRRDMRKVTTFTIDPPDAKDFDDALSFQRLENGHVEVGVHIADVSHYVKPGTALDDEAQHRATSVYLVDRTVPMLPEKLSNNLCSLVPHEDRPVFSAVFELDMEGKIYKEWYGKSVIHSDHRFAYEEAQAVMDAGEGPYYEELTAMNTLAKIFQAKRFEKGAINFEEDEVKFELDEDGHPIRVFRKVRKDAHKMIEDWMLLANRKVCEHVYRMRKGIPLPFVYRIHDQPDEEKLRQLKQFVSTLGYRLDLTDEHTIHRSMNALMKGVEGKPEQSMIQSVAIRTMAKAVYSTDNIGHYGLGFQFYTHFTSPIRRYPDLLVHRMLDRYLQNDFSGRVDQLEKVSKHCTNREKRATEAERASIKHKQVEFLADKLGQQFEGIVSGVTSWGIYVELMENKCEGMVGMHSMGDDYYEVDPDNYLIRGRTTGNVIRLGDKVVVEVKETNLRSRTIDFLLIEHLESPLDDLIGDEVLSTPPRRSARKKPAAASKRGGGYKKKRKKK